jgi:hypothetical protein
MQKTHQNLLSENHICKSKINLILRNQGKTLIRMVQNSINFTLLNKFYLK